MNPARGVAGSIDGGEGRVFPAGNPRGGRFVFPPAGVQSGRCSVKMRGTPPFPRFTVPWLPGGTWLRRGKNVCARKTRGANGFPAPHPAIPGVWSPRCGSRTPVYRSCHPCRGSGGMVVAPNAGDTPAPPFRGCPAERGWDVGRDVCAYARGVRGSPRPNPAIPCRIPFLESTVAKWAGNAQNSLGRLPILDHLENPATPAGVLGGVMAPRRVSAPLTVAGAAGVSWVLLVFLLCCGAGKFS